MDRPPVVALDEMSKPFGAAALASGQLTGAEGGKRTPGDLGEHPAGARGEVVLGPPVVDGDATDQFGF